jgi:Raf kinase inhibitor-like YbhB/YbcL family protein
MNKVIWAVIIALVVALGGWVMYEGRKQQIQPTGKADIQSTQPVPAVTQTIMKISSPAFADNQTIPQKYTCDGASISIPLNFSDVPDGTNSLVLIVEDPDVPKNIIPSGLFVHWVIFNMPPITTTLAENQIPPGVQGNNSSGKLGYTGPCPPDRQHRYFFKLYALDTTLNLPPGATKEQVEAAMQGHILAQAQTIGLYNKIGNPQ